MTQQLAVVQNEAYNEEGKIQALATREAFLPLADAARFVLTTAGEDRNESAKVTDEMIGFINDQAAVLNSEEDTRIDGWVNLARA